MIFNMIMNHTALNGKIQGGVIFFGKKIVSLPMIS